MLFTPWNRYDSDAWQWILAVEDKDNQHLELGVRVAMDTLVRGMKSDLFWTDVASMIVQMGARTLEGAIINVKNPSTSWSNVNFVSGDYNRTTGLLGNGTTKHLDSNWGASEITQDDFAAWVVVHTNTTGLHKTYLGNGVGQTGTSLIRRSTDTAAGLKCQHATQNTPASTHGGFIGITRNNSADFDYRGNGSSGNNSRASQVFRAADFFAHAANGAAGAEDWSDGRMRMAAVGTAHSLADADTRTAAYIASIVALSL